MIWSLFLFSRMLALGSASCFLANGGAEQGFTPHCAAMVLRASSTPIACFCLACAACLHVRQVYPSKACSQISHDRWVGIRVGEAKQPGPSPVRHRLRRKCSVPSMQSQSTLSEEVNTPVSSLACPPTQHDSPGSVSDAQPQMPAPLKVTLTSGNPAELRCNYLPSVRSWRWQLHPRRLNCSRESRKGVIASLKQWLHHYEHHLADASRLEAVDLLHSLELAPPECPSSQPAIEALSASQHDQRMVSRPFHAREVPNVETCERILLLTAQDLLGQNIACQHTLPKQCVHEVASAFSWLNTTRLDTSLHVSQNRAAELMLVLLPRLLWPQPQKLPGEKKLRSHARPHLLHSRLNLLWQGDWMPLLEYILPPMEAPAVTEQPSYPQQPGLITPEVCKRVSMSVQQGRHQCGLEADMELGPGWQKCRRCC